MPGDTKNCVCLLSGKDLKQVLTHLHALLLGLPSDIPEGNEHYAFHHYFGPTDEDEEEYGPEGAVNHELEVRLCPHGRFSGLIQFRERVLVWLRLLRLFGRI